MLDVWHEQLLQTDTDRQTDTHSSYNLSYKNYSSLTFLALPGGKSSRRSASSSSITTSGLTSRTTFSANCCRTYVYIMTKGIG